MKKIKVIWCIVSVSIMALIFFFSSQTATESSDTSGRLATLLAKALGSIFHGEALENIMSLCQFIVRKGAHFLLYTILGISVYNSLPQGGRWTRFFIAVGICIVYAISDEVHQTFVDGRSGEIRDVFVDSTGSLVGAVLMRSAKCEMRN